MKKRCLSLLLAVAMLCTMMPVSALAADIPEAPPATELLQATPEEPQVTPEVPQATPEEPQATPEEPQATPETPPQDDETLPDGPTVAAQNGDGNEDPDTGIALLSLEDEPMAVANTPNFEVFVDGGQVKPGERINFGTIKKGTAAQKTLVFKNVSGTKLVLHVTSLPDLLTATSGGAAVTRDTSFTCEADGQFEITFTTRTNLNPDTYNRNVFLGLCNTDNGRDFYPFYLDFIVDGTKLTVTPNVTEKFYGQLLTPESIPVTITNESGDTVPDSLASLGYRLSCAGFGANANAGSYVYTLQSVGSSDYKVELNGSPELTVKPTTPEAQGLQKELSIHEGDSLDNYTPYQSVVNPYNPSKAVAGSFAWEATDADLTKPGEFDARWTFTPEDKLNYNVLPGTVHVTVTERIPTTLTHVDPSHTDTGVAHTVTYDGNPHGILNSDGWHYVSNRTPDNTVGIKISYRRVAGPDGTPEDATLAEGVYPTDAGTYELTVSIDAAGEYAAAAMIDTLTIEPRPISCYAELGSRRYDGTTDVSATYFSITNKVSGDNVDVTYTAKLTSPDVNNQAPVTFTLTGLTGSDAANYRLPDDPVSTRYVSIFLRKLTITPKDFNKNYGELLFLSAGDFVISGLVEGATAGLDFVSAGEPATAPVSGSPYSITAELTDTNYTFGDSMTFRVPELPNCGTITVAKATPQVNGELSVGEGKYGKRLGSVSLAGGFVNGNNAEMAVPGTLTWADPDQMLPTEGDTCTARWLFTPNDENYTSLEGDVEIKLVEDQPVLITVDGPTVFAYDGLAHTLAQYIKTTPENCPFSVGYFDAAGNNVENPGPTNAGTYLAVITVTDEGAPTGYIGSRLEVQLTINPVAPNGAPGELVINGTAEKTAPQGTTLESLKDQFSNGFAFNGKPVGGTFSWVLSAGSDGTVNADGQEVVWSFTPTESNFTTVGGIVKFTLAADDRAVRGAVYNLPETGSVYKDYAVIDITESALKPGETVTLFKDKQCLMPASDTVTVPEGAAELVIEIRDGVLSPTGDTDARPLYARITSSTKNAGSLLSYDAEPDFELLVDGTAQTGAIVVHISRETLVTVQSPNTITSTKYDLQPGTDSYVTCTQSDPSLTLQGTKAGDDATLTVTVTFKHPDPSRPEETVAVTKTFPVTCPGRLDLDIEKGSGTDIPDMKLDMDPDEMHRAVYNEERDDKDLSDGKEVDYILHVAECNDGNSRQAIDDALNAENKGYVAAQYFDITLARYVNKEKTDDIYETTNPLRITVQIGEKTLQDAKKVTGYPQFVVVRVHKNTDGNIVEVKVLEDLDENLDTFTFETDRFSTYAIAYRNPKGDLTVSKTVTGNGDKTREFHFTVILDDKSIDATGTKTPAAGSGASVLLTDGEASFTLTHGQSITFDLPAGVTYTVHETEANQDGYTTTSTNAAGTVQEGANNVTFVNDIPVSEPGTPPTNPPAQQPADTGSGTAGGSNAAAAPARQVSTVPQTSDDSHLELWVWLLGLSAFGLTVTALLYWKRRKTYTKGNK